MKASSKRILSIFGALLLIGSTFFVYENFIKSSYDKIQKSKGEIESLGKAINEEAGAVNQVKELINTYKSQAQLENALSLTLPTSKDMPYLMADIDGLAESSGLTVKSILFKDLPSRQSSNSLANNIGVLEIQTRLSGSYEGIKSFIRNIETNVRIMDVQGMQIDSGIKSGQSSSDLILSAHAYYQLK